MEVPDTGVDAPVDVAVGRVEVAETGDVLTQSFIAYSFSIYGAVTYVELLTESTLRPPTDRANVDPSTLTISNWWDTNGSKPLAKNSKESSCVKEDSAE